MHLTACTVRAGERGAPFGWCGLDTYALCAAFCVLPSGTATAPPAEALLATCTRPPLVKGPRVKPWELMGARPPTVEGGRYGPPLGLLRKPSGGPGVAVPLLVGLAYHAVVRWVIGNPPAGSGRLRRGDGRRGVLSPKEASDRSPPALGSRRAMRPSCILTPGSARRRIVGPIVHTAETIFP